MSKTFYRVKVISEIVVGTLAYSPEEAEANAETAVRLYFKQPSASLAQLKAFVLVDENELPDLPIGTRVRYWPISRNLPCFADKFIETITRSESWRLGDGAKVVLVDGLTGGVRMTSEFMEVIQDD